MKPPKKITYVISAIDYSLGFLWLATFIDRTKYNPRFIFIGKTTPSLLQIFKEKSISCRFIQSGGKWSYPLTMFKLWTEFLFKRPDIVHAQLVEAGLLTLPSALLAGIKRRIYTRHHATCNIYYYPYMVKFDKLINRLSTSIISISQNVSDVLTQREGVPSTKIILAPHGFLFDEFLNPPSVRVAQIKEKYNPNKRRPVIGVISRFIELKGIQYIISAFKRILNEYPDALLVLANTSGDYKEQIQELLNELPEESYIKVPFEKDLFALYQLFDIFIHVPIEITVEAYGQVYIEALAAGIPSIFTISGIARDFIQHESNALVVPYKNSEAIYLSINRFLKESQLKENIIQQGRKDATTQFSLTSSLEKMYKAYED